MIKPLFFLGKKENEEYKNIAIYSNVRSAIDHIHFLGDSELKNYTPERRKRYYEMYQTFKPIKIYMPLQVFEEDDVFYFRDWRIVKVFLSTQFDDLKDYGMLEKWEGSFKELGI